MTELNCSLRSLQIALEADGDDEVGGSLANIAASGASNQQSAMREQKDQ